MAKEIYRLLTSDGFTLEVEKEALMQSVILKDVVEAQTSGSLIPVQVKKITFCLVLEYLRAHTAPSGDPEKEDRKVAADVKVFDEKFVEYIKKDWKIHADVMLAADYLHIKSLLDLTYDVAADVIQDMTVDKVRELFCIKPDLTTEEEAAIRNQIA